MTSVQIVPSNPITSALPGMDVLQDPASGDGTQGVAFISEFQAALGLVEVPIEIANAVPQPIATPPITAPELSLDDADVQVVSLQSLPGFIVDQLSTAANISAATSKSQVDRAATVEIDDVGIEPTIDPVTFVGAPSLDAPEAAVAGVPPTSIDADGAGVIAAPLAMINGPTTDDSPEVGPVAEVAQKALPLSADADSSSEAGAVSKAFEYWSATESSRKSVHDEKEPPEASDSNAEVDGPKLALTVDDGHSSVLAQSSAVRVIEDASVMTRSINEHTDGADDADDAPVDVALSPDASAVTIAVALAAPPIRTSTAVDSAPIEAQRSDSAPDQTIAAVSAPTLLTAANNVSAPDVLHGGHAVERLPSRIAKPSSDSLGDDLIPGYSGVERDVATEQMIKPTYTSAALDRTQAGAAKFSTTISRPEPLPASEIISVERPENVAVDVWKPSAEAPKALADQLSTFGITIGEDASQSLAPGRRLISSDLLTALERANLYSVIGVTDGRDVSSSSQVGVESYFKPLTVESDGVQSGDTGGLPIEVRGGRLELSSAVAVSTGPLAGVVAIDQSMPEVAALRPWPVVDGAPATVLAEVSTSISRPVTSSRSASEPRQMSRRENVAGDGSRQADASYITDPRGLPGASPNLLTDGVSDIRRERDERESAPDVNALDLTTSDAAREGATSVATMRHELTIKGVATSFPEGLTPQERTVTLDARAAAWDSSQVRLEVNKMIREGGGEVVIHLKPKDEGPIRISVKLEAANLATVVVDGGSEAVRSRLDQGAEQLRSQMAQMGLNLQLDMRQGGQSQGSNSWRGQTESSVPLRGADIAVTQVVRRAEVGSPRDAQSGVNLRA